MFTIIIIIIVIIIILIIMFQTVKEASEFWKLLCEQEGSGDPSAHHGWEREVRETIKDGVPEPREDGTTLESTSTRKVITKKKNRSAPGSDKIFNFVGKKHVPYTRACPRVFKQSQTNPQHSLVVYGQ